MILPPELEEVKLALAVENEKLRRLLEKLSEQRGRIGLLEQKSTILTQYLTDFTDTAAEFMKYVLPSRLASLLIPSLAIRQMQERQKEMGLSTVSEPVVSVHTDPVQPRKGSASGKAAAGPVVRTQEKPASPAPKRWGLWSEQKADSPHPHDFIICIEGNAHERLVSRLALITHLSPVIEAQDLVARDKRGTVSNHFI